MMKWLFASLRLRRLGLASLALALSLAWGCPRVEAGSRAETNAWNKLRNLAFEDAEAPIVWAVVETDCEQFVQGYATSEHVPDVLGIEAKAMFRQHKYDAIIAKFSVGVTNADKAADQFVYWTARSYFEKKNYRAAADNFARLAREYPASLLRLEAIYRECETYANLHEWQRVIEELGESNGVFQQFAKANPNDQWVVSGLLLLAEAELGRQEFDGARKTLSGIAVQTLRPELEWKRQYLVCRQLAATQPKDALAATTNLLTASAGNNEWKARSIILKGAIYEQLRMPAEAAQTYETNLNSELPPDLRQQALARIVELMLLQDKTEEAAQKLSGYLAKFSGENGSDFEWLMLGELALKREYLTAQSPAAGQGTNLLLQAEEDFNKVIKGFTNSPYTGKAELDLGWCYAKEGKIPEGLGAFSNAVEHLPFSEDQAVARFKLADTLFLQGNFAGAVSNYNEIVERYGSLRTVKNGLFEQALYQLVRAGLAETNEAVATNAVNKILTMFPDGMLAEHSLLLLGQSQDSVQARNIFNQLASHYPNSPLLPEMKLAVARTFEKENNWSGALAQYDDWVKIYTNNSALPRAEFARAWAQYKAGGETNAFVSFTNFIVRFQTNDLALSNDLPAQAQYWLGDYYWRQQEFQQAEVCYKEIFSKWPLSPLALPAKMMAGRAAFEGQRPQTATNYFNSLIADSNCPPALKAQAEYALGDADMQLPPGAEAYKYSNSMQVFSLIATDPAYTNEAIAARAWARLGDCYFALNGDDATLAATNAAAREAALQRYAKAIEYFQKATNCTQADVSTRSMVEIRLGQTLAAMAALKPAAERERLLEDALDHYFDVLYEQNLRENETADMLCVKEAGLEAGKLAGEMGSWEQARQIYKKLLEMMPPLQSTIEKKIAYAEAQLNAQKK